MRWDEMRWDEMRWDEIITLVFMPTYFGCRKFVTKESISCERQDGDDDGGCRPEIYTPRIQILPAFQTLQLGSPTSRENILSTDFTWLFPDN